MPVRFKNIIKKTILGRSISQEYLCLKDNLHTSVEVKLRFGETSIDVTGSHLFLGYKPLIIAIIVNQNDESLSKLKNLKFITLSFEVTGRKIAELDLKQFNIIPLGQHYCFIYTGMQGRHKFLFPMHNLTNSIVQKFRVQKEGNIALPGNLYEQVKIAYSVPRAISLISIRENNLYNVFPTDLNGRAGTGHYIISLRTDKKANEQLNKLKCAVICKMAPENFKEVYLMGKNHSKDLRTAENFRFGNEVSPKLENKIPEGTVSYVELKWTNSVSIGIHNVNFMEIINEEILKENSPSLSHIHRDYAVWRKRNGLETNYILR